MNWTEQSTTTKEPLGDMRPCEAVPYGIAETENGSDADTSSKGYTSNASCATAYTTICPHDAYSPLFSFAQERAMPPIRRPRRKWIAVGLAFVRKVTHTR